MLAPTPNDKQQDTADRAERIQAAITTLESKIRQIMQEGGGNLVRDVIPRTKPLCASGIADRLYSLLPLSLRLLFPTFVSQPGCDGQR